MKRYKVKLTQGKYALVDKEDFEMVSKHANWQFNQGYAVHTFVGGVILMHRLIVSAKKGEIIDHINRDTLDNRKSNLRVGDVRHNLANQPKTIKRKTTSKYKGVHLKDNKWIAQIGVNRGTVFLGQFNEEKEAAKAYNRAAFEQYGEFAWLNNIE